MNSPILASRRPYRMRPLSVATSFSRNGVPVRLFSDGSLRVGGAKILPKGSPEHHGRILVCRAREMDAEDFRDAAGMMAEVDRLHEHEVGFPGVFLLRLLGRADAA